MSMNSKDVQFWRTEGINYLHWQGAQKFYEGEENVKIVADFVGKDTVRDVGCGYGRLVENYDPAKYTGYDICESAIKKARSMNPKYTFYHWDYSTLAPAAVTTFINGPHLVSDLEIEKMIDLLCKDTNAVVFAEPMNFALREHWKYLPYGVYTRDIETYDTLFEKRQFKRIRTHNGIHFTNKIEYTAARWNKYEYPQQ